jgi:hypothetical protein
MKLGHNFVSWLTATVIVVSAMLTVVLVAYYTEWQPLPSDGSTRRWRSGNVIHIDRNHDGVVDEINIELEKTNDFLIKRDSDLDGWFDLQYQIRSNLAVRLEKIREKAPKH